MVLFFIKFVISNGNHKYDIHIIKMRQIQDTELCSCMYNYTLQHRYIFNSGYHVQTDYRYR